MATPEQLFSAPIPGQSLTQSPDRKLPFERPPKFSSVVTAMDHLFEVCTSPKFAKSYSELLVDDEYFVDRLAGSMLEEGFINGLWTVDMIYLLIEPLLALLVFVAAQMGYTVRFSNDTGFEDRTGYDYLTEMVVGDINIGVPEEAPEAAPEGSEQPAEPAIPTQATPVGGAGPAPTLPNVPGAPAGTPGNPGALPNLPNSPLIGG